MNFVHETAWLDLGEYKDGVFETRVGDGTKIWHFAHVMAGASIGENCTIGQSVHIASRVKIGNGCKIQNGAQLFEGVTLEDDVFIGPHVVFTNVMTPRAFVDRKAEFKPTLVTKGASIGANATILCGVTIGEYALVGAGSVVADDVPAYGVVYGVPALRHGFACVCGAVFSLTMRGITQFDTCGSCKRVYEKGIYGFRPVPQGEP